MELEKILNNYLEGKEKIEENMISLNYNLNDSSKNKKDEEEYEEYEEDEDEEEYEEYEEDEDEEDYDDEEEYEDEEDEDEEDYEDEDIIDIEIITDIEKMKIVCNILNHIENYYPGLEKVIMTLQDIIEENEY